MKMIWELDPYSNNPDSARLHTDAKLPRLYQADRDNIRASLFEKTPLPKETEAFARDVLAVSGVTEMSCGMSDCYAAYIKKGRVFGWEEIKPLIEAVFRRHFGRPDKVL